MDHKMLLDKIKCIGFSEKKKKKNGFTFTNTLSFSVSLDNLFPKAGAINCVVPHESMLGP